MLEDLKKRVCLANLDLVKKDLVIYTWGNVSGIDREKGLIVIKPSGVDYEGMSSDDMVVVDFDANVVEGKYLPSSDTKTHIELYKSFPNIQGVVHTHSKWATIWAQGEMPLPAYGTTHADYFYGDIPISRSLSKEEIEQDYEKNTGLVIVETFRNNTHNEEEIKAILVKNHGPFVWGSSPEDAVFNAHILEKVAEMAFYTKQLNNSVTSLGKGIGSILDKHYLRKHGKDAYYGQKNQMPK